MHFHLFIGLFPLSFWFAFGKWWDGMNIIRKPNIPNDDTIIKGVFENLSTLLFVFELHKPGFCCSCGKVGKMGATMYKILCCERSHIHQEPILSQTQKSDIIDSIELKTTIDIREDHFGST